GDLRRLAGLPPDRPGQVQREIRARLGSVPTTSVFDLQEDADRARLRHQAERPRLSRLYGQADRRQPEELDVDGADHALGRRAAAPLRRLGDGVGGGALVAKRAECSTARATLPQTPLPKSVALSPAGLRPPLKG